MPAGSLNTRRPRQCQGDKRWPSDHAGADKGYDTADFIAAMRRQDVTPHVTQNNNRRRSAMHARTTPHAVYNLSQRMRKRIEEVFGWVKTGGRAAQNTRPRH